MLEAGNSTGGYTTEGRRVSCVYACKGANLNEGAVSARYVSTFGRGNETVRFILYERMLVYYYLCGIVGHLEKKCSLRFGENFIDPGTKYPYGEWLKAVPFASQGPVPLNEMGRGRMDTQSHGVQERARGVSIY